ncbi:MAG: adenylate/guanylate cyclase domain-containing protein [Chloroflexota bacterium]
MKWLARLSTHDQILAVFSLFALLTGLLVWSSTAAILSLRGQVARAHRQSDVLINAARVRSTSWAQQVADKNYLLTGRSSYALAFARYADNFDAHLRNVLLKAETMEQRSSLTTLEATQRRYNDAALNSHALRSSGTPNSQHSAAAASIEQSDPAAGEVTYQISKFIWQQAGEIAATAEVADQTARQALLVGLAALVGLALLLMFGVSVADQLTNPVLRLTSAVAAFESGAFDPQALTLDQQRQDDLGQLARAFTHMAGTIQSAVQQQANVLRAAQRFIPTAYLEFLEKSDITDIQLGDHVSAEMTVMFTDLYGFTSLSEKMTAQENFNFVNAYLQLVSPLVQQHNGLVVKFLGDGMMAIFPYGVDDAVKSAIAQQNAIREFNAHLEQNSLPPIQAGAGIHTGHLMVGIIGDALRLQGDAFSDTVNLTARIEGLTRQFGSRVLLTEQAVTRLERAEDYHLRFIGRVQVVGHKRPLGLYEIYSSEEPEVVACRDAARGDFQAALRHYSAGRFAEAGECLQQVLECDPLDRTAARYLEKVRQMAGRPLPEDWEGVEVMGVK